MRRSVLGLLLLTGGCAAAGRVHEHTEAPRAPSAPVLTDALPESSEVEAIHAAVCIDPDHHPTVHGPDPVAGVDELPSDGSAEGAPEEEERVDPEAATAEIRYSTDLSDEELTRRWRTKLDSLGSISVGFAHDGRLINGVQFPAGDGRAWVVISPATTWGTQETVDYLTAVAARVKSAHPDAFPLRVNEISAQDGGHLRPHRSHQNGRDVDLGFYYPTDPPPRVGARERVIAVDQNWSLVRALVTMTDVQVILVDRRVQEVLYDYALSIGEERAWLDALFRAGNDSIIQHAPRHRDHFHVRFYNPRAQELGRRVAPLLAERPEHNLISHRVRYGDTLSGIAVRYGSSIRAIQKANRMKGTFLRASQLLKVPLFGPCTRCPVPPPVEVPPRRMPPEPERPSITMLHPRD